MGRYITESVAEAGKTGAIDPTAWTFLLPFSAGAVGTWILVGGFSLLLTKENIVLAK